MIDSNVTECKIKQKSSLLKIPFKRYTEIGMSNLRVLNLLTYFFLEKLTSKDQFRYKNRIYQERRGNNWKSIRPKIF